MKNIRHAELVSASHTRRILDQMIRLLCILILVSSCQRETPEFNNIQELMEIMKTENNLSEYPTLQIDGFDYNYSILKESIKLEKEQIGFYEFNKKGILRIISNLPEIPASEFNVYHIELNDEKINLNTYKKLRLEEIIKKGIIRDQKVNDSLYGGSKTTILIYTK